MNEAEIIKNNLFRIYEDPMDLGSLQAVKNILDYKLADCKYSTFQVQLKSFTWKQSKVYFNTIYNQSENIKFKKN